MDAMNAALRDENLVYAAALRQAGVEAPAQVYPGQQHGFVQFYKDQEHHPLGEAVLRAGIAFIRRKLAAAGQETVPTMQGTGLEPLALARTAAASVARAGRTRGLQPRSWRSAARAWLRDLQLQRRTRCAS